MAKVSLTKIGFVIVAIAEGVAVATESKSRTNRKVRKTNEIAKRVIRLAEILR